MTISVRTLARIWEMPMKCFGVWWFDLLLALFALCELARFLPFLPSRILSVLGTLLTLALTVALLYIGASLTELLVVLTLSAALSSGLAYLEMRLADRGDKGKEGEP